MRLFLTSGGFPKEAINCRQEFLNLVGIPTDKIRVAFIPTASRVEKDRSFMEQDRRELTALGIPETNVSDLELDHKITPDELSAFDVIYVDGGNTFYLLQEVQKSGFSEAIREYLEKDFGVYVGVSAGTVLAGPDVDFVADWDPKTAAPELKDTTGLGFVDTAYCPHYNDSERETVERLRKLYSYKIEELRDGEAVLVNGEEVRKVVDY